jgi:hypothetical protein
MFGPAFQPAWANPESARQANSAIADRERRNAAVRGAGRYWAGQGDVVRVERCMALMVILCLFDEGQAVCDRPVARLPSKRHPPEPRVAAVAADAWVDRYRPACGDRTACAAMLTVPDRR